MYDTNMVLTILLITVQDYLVKKKEHVYYLCFTEFNYKIISLMF